MSIGVTVIGGFLGAGKTTALNHLLRRAKQRVAVMVNDFGAINIDAQLIERVDGDLTALTNGCVCCSIGDGLSASLARVAERSAPPDRIFIEASGVADPWRIAQVARLQPGVVLDAVMVLVDGAAFDAQVADRWLTDTIERQVARADLIVMTKCDIADLQARAATREAVARLRPDVPIVEITAGELPDLAIEAPKSEPLRRFAEDMPEHGFRRWAWETDDFLDVSKFRALTARLPNAVLRAKGICRLGPQGTPHLLQLAGRRWSLEPWLGKIARTGIVVIGTRDLPPDAELARLFTDTRIGTTP